MLRKSINFNDLNSFIKANTMIFNKNFSTYSLLDLLDCFLKSGPSSDNLILNFENDIIKSIILNTTQSQHILLPSENYIGIQNNELTCVIKPLEELILEDKIVPITLDSNFIIKKSSESFSGLHKVVLTDIAIKESSNYNLTDTDLKINNTNQVSFDFTKVNEVTGSGYFGIKNFNLIIPMYSNINLLITPETNNCVFSPIDIPPDMDGAGGMEAAIGIKSISLSAARTVLTTKAFAAIARSISKTVLKKASTILNEKNKNCICFSEIKIPKLNTCFSTNVCSTTNDFWSGETVVLDSADLDTNNEFGTQAFQLSGLFPGSVNFNFNLLSNGIYSLLKLNASTDLDIAKNIVANAQVLKVDLKDHQIGLSNKAITSSNLTHDNNFVNRISFDLPVIQESKEIEIYKAVTSFDNLCRNFTIIEDSTYYNNFSINLSKLADCVVDTYKPSVFIIENDLNIRFVDNFEGNTAGIANIITKDFSNKLPCFDSLTIKLPPVPILNQVTSITSTDIIGINILPDPEVYSLSYSSDYNGYKYGYTYSGLNHGYNSDFLGSQFELISSNYVNDKVTFSSLYVAYVLKKQDQASYQYCNGTCGSQLSSESACWYCTDNTNSPPCFEISVYQESQLSTISTNTLSTNFKVSLPPAAECHGFSGCYCAACASSWFSSHSTEIFDASLETQQVESSVGYPLFNYCISSAATSISTEQQYSNSPITLILPAKDSSNNPAIYCITIKKSW